MSSDLVDKSPEKMSIYDEEFVEILLEDDEITSEEAAFMRGYES